MKTHIRSLLCIFICLTLILSASGGAFAATKSSDSVKISSKNKVVIMRVSYATGEFNGSWGGVMTAVPEKDADVYTLYDVVIWSDRISLYKFNGNINDAANEYIKEHHPDPFYGNGEYAEVWREFRESCCLKTFKVKSEESNPEKNSSKRLKAYKAFFDIIKENTPSKHVAIKYSGHGGGKTFCCSLNVKDTLTILKYGVKTFGRKFAFVDYGTNCVSGCTDVLDYYADYTDYMVINQLNYGGWQMDDWDYEVYKKIDTDYNYSDMFVKGEYVSDAVKRLAKQHIKEWPSAAKYMKKNKIAQSVTAVNMKNYKVLMKALKKKPSWHSDLKTYIKKTKSSSLLKKYNNAVIYYARNKSQLGTWKNSYGYGLWYTS